MYFCTFGDKESKTRNKCCGWAWLLKVLSATHLYDFMLVCHLFGKIHQNKAPAPLLTSRNEGNVLSVPPLETHGMVLWVICHCWQVFYAALSGPVEHHVLWHTPGSASTLNLFFVSCSVPKHFRSCLTKFSQCSGHRKMVPWEMGLCLR